MLLNALPCRIGVHVQGARNIWHDVVILLLYWATKSNRYRQQEAHEQLQHLIITRQRTAN
eukprot:10310-Heterococcus_DN1.PRE.3